MRYLFNQGGNLKGNLLGYCRNTSYLRRSAFMTTLEICLYIASFSEALITALTSLRSTVLDSWFIESFLSSQRITCERRVLFKTLKLPHLIIWVVLAEVVDVLDILVLDHRGANPDEMNSCRKAPRSLRLLFDRDLQLDWTSHHLIVEICQWTWRQVCHRKRLFCEFRCHMCGEKINWDEQERGGCTGNKSSHLGWMSEANWWGMFSATFRSLMIQHRWS